MIIIDSLDTVSLVFDGSYSGVLSGLTLTLHNKSTNVTTTKTFSSILLTNSRYTELEIDWADELDNGQYYYYLYGDGSVLDEGILKVELPITALPIYKNSMDEYVIYKN